MKSELPKYTIEYAVVKPKNCIGIRLEYYNDEELAVKRYNKLKRLNYAPLFRDFEDKDKQELMKIIEAYKEKRRKEKVN